MSQVPLNATKNNKKDKENSDELSMINELQPKKKLIT